MLDIHQSFHRTRHDTLRPLRCTKCHPYEELLRIRTSSAIFRWSSLGNGSQRPAHTQTPCPTLAVLIVYVLYDLTCIYFWKSRQRLDVVFRGFFMCTMGCVLKYVELSRLASDKVSRTALLEALSLPDLDPFGSRATPNKLS